MYGCSTPFIVQVKAALLSTKSTINGNVTICCQRGNLIPKGLKSNTKKKSRKLSTSKSVATERPTGIISATGKN